MVLAQQRVSIGQGLLKLQFTRHSAATTKDAPENRISTITPTGLPVRHVIAVALGNALQFYDFVTYAYFAAQIGRAFFPSDTPGTSLLASLATFGAGFLTRPLGALVLGDRKSVV